MTSATGCGITIEDTPDRSPDAPWLPRQFTYGGRRFVWKEGGEFLDGVQHLYEVRKEWADPASQAGKMLDETFERVLVRSAMRNTFTFGMDHVGTVSIAGGLGPELFREYLVASLLTQRMICIFGD